MKEIHLFYTPNIVQSKELSPEESHHAVKVLRHTEGDEVLLCDGNGIFYRATIAVASQKRCAVSIVEAIPSPKHWLGNIAIAVAPTKNMDRMEWFAEKATEVGVDAFHFVACANSERRVLKEERIEKVVVSAMKQSRKSMKPVVHPLTSFKQFLQTPFEGQKFIAHCYTQAEVDGTATVIPCNIAQELSEEKPLLHQMISPTENTLVLIGPEGDFSLEEVRQAQEAGFMPISLGKSRLRTETAALMAVHMMLLAKQK